MWLRQLLQELLKEIQTATELLIDNQNAIKLANSITHHKLTKHIDIKYHYIRDYINNNRLVLKYVPSKGQLADFLKKEIPKGKVCKRL